MKLRESAQRKLGARHSAMRRAGRARQELTAGEEMWERSAATPGVLTTSYRASSSMRGLALRRRDRGWVAKRCAVSLEIRLRRLSENGEDGVERKRSSYLSNTSGSTSNNYCARLVSITGCMQTQFLMTRALEAASLLSLVRG